MKVLIFSDSHGFLSNMIDAIDREQPDALIHLGDCTDDVSELEEMYPALPIYRVRGNNDFERDNPPRAVITLEQTPIYMTHGHREHITLLSYGEVPQNAYENGCQLAFYGHTHCALLKNVRGVIVCNPGSISLPRDGSPSYARLLLENGRVQRLSVCKKNGSVKQEIKG